MANRPPPFDALYTFSVVARCGSMSRAAERLFVTQSAVSRQIRQLEDQLGVALLQRQARGVALTAAGNTLLPAVEQLIDGLQRTLASLAPRRTDLRIKLPPTLALRWFLPRLPQFQRQYPELEVRMSTAAASGLQFERDGFDAAILQGEEIPAGAHAVALFTERLTPVCSPAIAQRLVQPSDLAQQALVHLSADAADWRAWLHAAGVSHPAVASGPSFEVIDMAVNVASQGLGVALADPLLVADDLLSGRLIAPFRALAVETGCEYYFVCPRALAGDAHLLALCQWLQREMAASLAAVAPPA